MKDPQKCSITRYLLKTQGNAKELFQRVYKDDWEWIYNQWHDKGTDPLRVRVYCEAELSRMVLQELRRGHVRPH